MFSLGEKGDSEVARKQTEKGRNVTNIVPRALNTLICLGAITAMKYNTKTYFIIIAWIMSKNLNFIYYILYKEGRKVPWRILK